MFALNLMILRGPRQYWVYCGLAATLCRLFKHVCVCSDLLLESLEVQRCHLRKKKVTVQVTIGAKYKDSDE